MSSTESRPKRILFVCLGNICRSPMAEIICRQLLSERMGAKGDQYVFIDSAGTTGYHAGESPDSRTVATCKKHYGKQMLPVTHRSRQVRDEDFTEFDYILCMDRSNLRDLMSMKPRNTTAEIKMLGSFDPTFESGSSALSSPPEVPDPYYGGQEGFESNFQQITRCCNALLDSILKQ